MSMKSLLLLLAAMGAASTAYAADATGRSYFQPRLPWAEQALMLSNDARHLLSDEDAGRFSFASMVQYQGSTDDSKFAKYFLPHGKNDLVVKGAAAAGDCDISATWLQVVGSNPAPAVLPGYLTAAGAVFHAAVGPDYAVQWFNAYSSSINVKPHFERTSATTQLRYNNKLFSVPWSLAIGLPVAQMRSSLELREASVVNNYETRAQVPALNTATLPTQNIQPQYSLSVIEALSNPNKHYAKISSRPLEVQGIGDLSLDLSARPLSFLTLGVRGELPTSQKGTAEYLFEPLVGNNGHGTIAAYAQLEKEVLSFACCNVALKGYAQYQAQLPSHEMRTFDLKAAGPWSRYLLMVDAANNPFSAESGVNFLTRSVRVGTMQSATLGLGADAHWKGFSGSLGYSVFAREQEKLSLRSALPEQLFIAGQLAPVAGGAVKNKIYAGEKTVSVSDHIKINVDAAGPIVVAGAGLPGAGPADLAIGASDLDLKAASMPHYFSHQLMATLGYAGEIQQQPLQLNVGGSYEMLRYGNGYNVYSLFGSLTLKI